MTDILCNWINDVNLSSARKIDAANFAREFASGYFIGELLNKYQLQDDFDQFSQSKTADSKLNNFTRLEPILHLLEVPFDTNIARDIMTEKHGTATRLLYQLFIALNKKQKNKLTGVAMEAMRPAAPVKLEGVESTMYKERLKHMTPRQTDLNLDALVGHFHTKQIEMEKTAFKERFEEEERHLQQLQVQRQELMRKHKESQTRKSDMLAKIHSESSLMEITIAQGKQLPPSRAANVHIPKPPPSKSVKAISQRREQKRLKEAQDAEKDIAAFEEKLLGTMPPSKPVGGGGKEAKSTLQNSIDLIKPASNDEYINKIRKQLNEDASARAEREKRRRKVLVDQLKAHEAQEEARREEMLVNRLMRQSQMERKIAVQLLQARQEKEVIKNNRLLREKQYEEQRLRDFDEALNKEAELARLSRLEYIEQTRADRELHNKIAMERAEQHYQKHYNMCRDIMMDITDFTTKIGEYRELTNNLLPPKLMRDWKNLFVEGNPLYSVEPGSPQDGEEPTVEQILEQKRQDLLDEGDFTEYRNMIGEWQPPEEGDIHVAGPPRDNPIVGHIVQRLFNIVHPPSPPPPAPEFPAFPIKACVLGKVFGGKTSCVRKLAQSHRLEVLSVEELVKEAVEAHKNGEIIEINVDSTEAESPQAAITVDGPDGEATPEGSPTGGDITQQTSAPNTPLDNKQLEQIAAAAVTEEEKKDEGTEKTDPEKPVPDDQQNAQDPTVNNSDKMSNKGPPQPQASARALLGQKAVRLLKKGRPVDDALMVEILIEAIKNIPEGTGWVLDGFPSTYAQAKLLEKALSGYDAVSRESSKQNLKEVKTPKGRKSVLAPDPKPAPPPPEPSSGINVVVLFDVEDEVCLKRSAGRTYATQEDKQYQEEFNPPPEGSVTGMGNQEPVLPVKDAAHDQEQIQHRLTSFQDAWPKLEKWFTKFGTLKPIDASQMDQTVFLEVEKIFEDTINKLLGKDEEESLVLEISEPKEDEKPPEPAPTPQEPPPEPTKDTASVTTESKKSCRSGSGKRADSKGDRREKSKSPARPGSKGKGSRVSTPKSPKRSRSGKRGKSPELEAEAEPEPAVPPGTPPPQPGSDQWEYVDQPIDEELAQILSKYWEAIEGTYINTTKHVFHNIRDEREQIIRHFFQIRENYLNFLRRPDHKQEFVSQWQEEYNSLPDDIRDDDETRSDLHQRVDDLRERLWSICDERKELAEQERSDVMTEGWLEDHVGLLCNHYITLMQAEVDRYQDTVHTLKDYYKGMEGKIPEDLNAEFSRIPLIELPPQDEPGSDAKSVASDSGTQVPAAIPSETAPQPPVEEIKSSSKSVTPSGRRKKGQEQVSSESLNATEPPAGEDVKTTRIPLVPRRPLSPDPNQSLSLPGGKGSKQDKGKGKASTGKADIASESPVPTVDPDDKLIFDSHVAATNMIDTISAAEQAACEAQEEAEKEKEREKEKEKERQAAAAQKKGGGKKKGKSRSPSPKKGREKDPPVPATPLPSAELESEEEKEKKIAKERARQEFFAAIKEEGVAAKLRLELVKLISLQIISDLRLKADAAYNDMNDWLGARFLKEMESIDHMSEVMRNAVETSSRIREEIMIYQQELLLNEDVKVLKSPTPVPRPAPVEQAMPETFTLDQILNLYTQFALTAPTGVISVKGFHEIFTDLISLTHGAEQIPDIWTNMLSEKLEVITNQLSPDREYVDWRAFLLTVAHPWPVPTQSQLLDTLCAFQEMDWRHTGYVTREQYDRVDVWFKEAVKPPTPTDPWEPFPYDRLGNLKGAFFDMFADHNTEPSQLDYVDMLLYFTVMPDPNDGFMRALSVAEGTHMPRLHGKLPSRKPSRPSSQNSLPGSIELEVEKPPEDENEGEQEAAVTAEDIPEDAIHATVQLDSLHKVLHHGQRSRGDSHRFSVTADPEDAFSKERLAGVYQELGSTNLEPLLFSVLIEHPVIQDIISTVNHFKALDLKAILDSQTVDINQDTQSARTGE